LLMLLCGSHAVAAASLSAAEVRKLLNDHGMPENHAGLYIAPVDGNDEPISLNATQSFNPASVIKLLPSLAALELFSPAYQWSTRVYTDGELVGGGTLNGNLYIRGEGDPYLTVESAWSLLRAVRARGIGRINGALVVDDGVFKLPRFDRAAFDDKPHRIYNGPANALMVNFWAVQFTISALADRVHIDAFPGSRYLEIVNQVKHSGERCRGGTRYVSYQARETNEAVVVTFSGTLSNRCPPVVIARAVIPTERYLEYVLPGLWRDAGGILEGRVKRGVVPDGATNVYTHLSRPMAEIVRATNKFSNNMMARHLLLTLGKLNKERDVEIEDGVKVLEDWLLSRGIEVPGLNLDNGSGLSRDTRISATGMANVLRAGFYSPYGPEFLASLPIAGEDWALESRNFGQRNTSVRVKTGLIDHVRSMAGYITSGSGRTYIVVLLVNHPDVHRGLGTRLQNAVIRYVLDL